MGLNLPNFVKPVTNFVSVGFLDVRGSAGSREYSSGSI